jgi:hypothetical protein
MNPAASAERSCRCRGCCTFLRDRAETEFKVSRIITRRSRELMHVEASPSTLPMHLPSSLVTLLCQPASV